MSRDEIMSVVETERKYDIDDSTPVPRLIGFQARRNPSPQLLQASYFDTTDEALAARSIVLRRRVGGHDEGWHLKEPGPEGRIEHHAALSDQPPSGLIALIQAHLSSATFIHIAQLTTVRSTTIVLDRDETALAEIADDLVSATDIRTGRSTGWREWEVELSDGAPADRDGRTALLDKIETELLQAGATPSRSMSKLAHALGRNSLA